MNSFKAIRDELEQAVNAIEAEPVEGEEDLFAFLFKSDDVEMDQALLNSMMEEEAAVEESAEEPVEDESAAEPASAVKEASKCGVSEEDRNAVNVITKGTTINGSIISDGSLDVMGTINGDIECLGRLTITGKVTGNSLASEVVVNTDRLEGSIVSKGDVRVGSGTVVIGDITAASAVLAGAVKGEIDVDGPVVLDSTAIIKGNIKAKSIQMVNGAVMDGFYSLSYADLKIDDIFE